MSINNLPMVSRRNGDLELVKSVFRGNRESKEVIPNIHESYHMQWVWIEHGGANQWRKRKVCKPMKKEKGVKVHYQTYKTVPKWILDLGRSPWHHTPGKVLCMVDKSHKTPAKMKPPILGLQRAGKGGATENHSTHTELLFLLFL